ncbi:MAG: tRNA preQ1(34) S-adenosylmethionine ribosyltransferase-isomerase QueA [Methylococcaceae bacterium]|nr:tRNA preQ1(34) S-adenosylmethionine ribosyltransferase-isomerase QueA [Methylococcaceae bacterium]
MRKSDFRYDLPNRLIARNPLENRTASRMLTLDGKTGEIRDLRFLDLVDLVKPGDLLVFNNTRVIPARLFGKKPSGGKVEILVERILHNKRMLAHTRSNKPMRPGTVIELASGRVFVLLERRGDLWVLEHLGNESIGKLLDAEGHIPLPSYIRRPDQDLDRERYQTVYAERPGAVAAPTAGLHFDENMIQKLRSKGVGIAYVTLHVGSGTFQPVRVENLEEHRMHSEVCEVDASVVSAVKETKSRRGKVIAVGSTSIRALETASQSGRIEIFTGETDLFITPGFRFACADHLLTNFHLPESTLLILVCAFAGYEAVMGAYRHAVREEYRFFSYGDAMFLTRAGYETAPFRHPNLR